MIGVGATVRAFVLALAVLLVVVLAAFVGCGAPSSSPATLTFSLPQALVSCQSPPAELQARLWVSGSDDPCFLDVDAEAGTTSGVCEVAPGIERRFTLDWFIDVGGRIILLAQAQRSLDLSAQTEANVTLSFTEDDVVVTDCKDMSGDSFNGSPTVDVGGVARPVCDLDGDGTSNLDEVCVGADPLGGG